MKCICCYHYNGKDYHLYVDLSVEIKGNAWFILLPSFKITKYMNNRMVPETVREVFEKRIGQYCRGEIHFKCQ